jgi:hypothetical protein
MCTHIQGINVFSPSADDLDKEQTCFINLWTWKYKTTLNYFGVFVAMCGPNLKYVYPFRGYNVNRSKKSFPSPKRPNQLSFPIIFLLNGYKGCVISGFCREVGKNCAILGYYAVSSGNVLPMFRDNLSVPTLGSIGPIFMSFRGLNPLKMGPLGCI